MRYLIKNIPPLTFGIAGNRGVGFPLTDSFSVLPQAEINCFLVKEDSITAILADNSDIILVDCFHSEDTCIIVLQENRNYYLLQQEEDEILCSWREDLVLPDGTLDGFCYLLMQENEYIKMAVLDENNEGDKILISCPDPTPPCTLNILTDGLSSVLVDQTWGDDFYLPCDDGNQNKCTITILENGIAISLVDDGLFGDVLFTDCELPHVCFLASQEDDCSPLVDNAQDTIVIENCEEFVYRCFVAIQEDESIALVDENAGDQLQFRCNMQAIETGCHISLEENEYTPLILPTNNGEGYTLTLQCVDEPSV